MSDDGGKKKIIIDEDWKTRVLAEKEEFEKKSQHEEGTPQQSTDEAQPGPLPPASFPVLLSMLASQAMISLGQVPSPITGKAEVRADEAKHFIDLIGMLEEKTKGNLSAEESAMLTNLLNELRMAFVSTATSTQPPATDIS